MRSAREIVAEAWHITVTHRSQLFPLGFVPSFFSLLVSAGYIFYQIQAFRHSHFFSTRDDHYMWELLERIWSTLISHELIFIGGIVVLFFLAVGWFFAPMLCRAALVVAVSDLRKGKSPKKPLVQSFFQFFPLFGANIAKRTLEPLSFFTEWSFVARNMGVSVGMLVIPFLFFFGLLGGVLLFFFSFTNQAIMLSRQDFTASIATSFRIVISHFSLSFRLLLIFLLIEMRVIFNLLVILAIPLLLVSFAGAFAVFLTETVGIIIAGVLSLILILLAAYLSGILFVLSEVIWTVAFLDAEEDREAHAQE